MPNPTPPRDPQRPRHSPLDYSSPNYSPAEVPFVWQVALAIGVTILALVLTYLPNMMFPSFPGSSLFLLIFPTVVITGLVFASLRGGTRSLGAALLGLLLTFVGLGCLALGLCFAAFR